MAALGHLPEEVMIEILSRLPLESLLRFKTVRKSWYALINDPNFATKCFCNSLHQQKHILLKRFVTKNSGNQQNVFSFLKFSLPFDGSVLVYDLDLPFDEDFRYFEIRGHSHGLLCLTDLRKDIFLCNPATREFQKLPRSILLTEPLDEFIRITSFTNAVGFGYDSKSRDFKVVRVVDFVELPCYFHPSRVEVYDLSKDKWREIQTPDRWSGIQTPICGKVFGTPCFEMYHEGTYYWWANAKIEGRAEIIQSFDMSEEVFRPIPMPKSLKGKCEAYRSMGVLNGSIVLFHYPWNGNGREFDLWGMENDESGGVSWSKLLTIGPLYGIEKPLVFVGSHELLMEANGGQVILYNTRTQQFRKLPIKGHERFHATVFVESLVSVKGGNNLTYEF
ncbi:F-box/kelch-repeat protein At3g23880-like [Cucurbita maxima]|uniref:F-box/kelch-repeat protein At3g23880-like n=1 Tax=Cucurbita maxima TaxID=3661 RepID=A0A6J1J5F7_CUCMA|nr:F-box/kelch-repeat protein At3g23880-like [Cucurbita maxima]